MDVWLTCNKLTGTMLNNQTMSSSTLIERKLTRKVNIVMFDSDSNLFKPLEEKKHIKYLGVIIDSNLCWKYHICHINSKLGRTIGIIARIRHHIPTNTLLTIYRLRSWLELCLLTIRSLVRSTALPRFE